MVHMRTSTTVVAIVAAAAALFATPLPARALTPSELLTDLSCPTSNWCMAVGGATDATAITHPISRVFDGASWTDIAIPSPGGISAVYSSVSCVSASWCMAVGSFNASGPDVATIAATWNGSSWSSVATPKRIVGASPSSVACLSTTNCTAIGSWFYRGGSNHFLVMRWDGAAWRSTPAGHRRGEMFMSHVSCVGTTMCVAVGATTPPNSPIEKPRIEISNGSSWTPVRLPAVDPAYFAIDLTGVSCTSSSRCVAVGTASGPGGFVAYSIVLDSSGWHVASVPAGAGDQLLDVSCATSTRCVAVGVQVDPGNISTPVVADWDGTTWTVRTLSIAGATSASLQGVDCTSGVCRAVGTQTEGTAHPALEVALPD